MTDISEIARNYAAAAQSVATTVAFGLGGWWAWKKWVLRQEAYPHIETAAEVSFVGHHGNYWVVELTAWVENKGSARHIMEHFRFDFAYMESNSDLDEAPEFGGQVRFGKLAKQGSFLPANNKNFFIQPSVKAKYSYITKVPDTATMVIFHWWFDYTNEPGSHHTAEATAKVPAKPSS